MFNNNYSSVFLYLIKIIIAIGNSDAILNGDDVGGVKFDPITKGMIVTGQDIYPYMVHIVVKGYLREEPGERSVAGCGGVIISISAVLTAAHCLEEFSSLESVRIHAGVVHLIFERNDGQFRNMQYYVKHDGYRGECEIINGKTSTCLNDIGIIFVDQPFKFGVNVKKARLSRMVNGPLHNKEGLILGWGNEMNLMLQKARMTVIASKRCQILYNNVYISDEMFCVLAEKNNHASCPGDSGGPFILNGVVHGVSSLGFSVKWGGIEACDSNKASIFTNVGSFYDWIKHQLKIHDRIVPKLP